MEAESRGDAGRLGRSAARYATPVAAWVALADAMAEITGLAPASVRALMLSSEEAESLLREFADVLVEEGEAMRERGELSEEGEECLITLKALPTLRQLEALLGEG